MGVTNLRIDLDRLRRSRSLRVGICLRTRGLETLSVPFSCRSAFHTPRHENKDQRCLGNVYFDTLRFGRNQGSVEIGAYSISPGWNVQNSEDSVLTACS